MALSKSIHDGGAEAETGLRKTPEGILEIDQSRMGGITQQTGGTGNVQTESLVNLATAFFIHDQQAGIPMLPSEGDRGSFAGVKGMGFFQKRPNIRQDHDPSRRMPEKFPQGLGDGEPPDGRLR